MSDIASEQRPLPPAQVLRMLRLRSGAATRHQLRQADLARLVGVQTRTVQQWENGERLPGATSLQRLIGALLAEQLFLPGEEGSEARGCGKRSVRAIRRGRLSALAAEHGAANSGKRCARTRDPIADPGTDKNDFAGPTPPATY